LGGRKSKSRNDKEKRIGRGREVSSKKKMTGPAWGQSITPQAKKGKAKGKRIEGKGKAGGGG